MARCLVVSKRVFYKMRFAAKGKDGIIRWHDAKGLRDFLATEYSKNFDFFLYKSVGYDKLEVITVGLFPTPYSMTSIREYFAIGFEEYLFGDNRQLKEISPALYGKIEQLINFV